MAKGKFDAEPTKEFFIHMLTKDIPLERAIIDLIDNSVDGAKTVMEKSLAEIPYSSFRIDIVVNENEFIISDNCGGFSKKAANEHAFKFGRPTDMSSEQGKGLVGRFGVGMKRALFKLGNYFVVESKCDADHFIVEEDVAKWQDEVGKWEFDFHDVNGEVTEEGLHSPLLESDGTYIKVTNLNDAVKLDFSLTSFKNRMISEIERTLNYTLESGLKIFFNKIELKSKPIQLLVSEDLKPYYFTDDISGVNVKIFAGIGEPNPNLAGWYIYCNDRLMVERDKTNLTGWEGGKNYYDDSGVQKFHNKVAMFRGIVFFSSDDPTKLPMTTTKWGIDVNSTIFKETRNKMIFAMRSVLTDLNRLDNAEQRQFVVDDSMQVDIVAYQQEKQDLTEEFKFPIIKKRDFGDDKALVSYRVDKDVLNRVKKHLKVSTNGDAGEKTFFYFVEMKELNYE
ncbi:hypothetical protein Belba_0951 [Belliella baltica DSM 15883]|uniref:Molecular chaperone of HSP90 family n=1 Tax=Belliella baltica (strain DSM 15883 / CIP 108006 / LMG 21964 / BA134) TaxID=866536 RepID=I3Z2X6_BELBD|nr:ATP-binding protein [Belliella baltica]AFL83594.1 hypothetical protein Belba_0951 [Belliella baltica DSM 15883]